MVDFSPSLDSCDDTPWSIDLSNRYNDYLALVHLNLDHVRTGETVFWAQVTICWATHFVF